MMRLVHLVRHAHHDEVGHVLSGRTEIALNGRGRAQAAALADWAATHALASLHSSPRRRAMETAMPVAQRLGLTITDAPALNEIEFGGFTGRRFAELANDIEWQRWNSERASARCPGGETIAEAVARARDYLWTLGASHTPALCVTHCDIIRGVVADLLGLSFDRMFALDCDPGSVTTLALGEGQARLVALNLPVQRAKPG